MKEKTIYDLKLHESIVVYSEHQGLGDKHQEAQRYYVTRVVGGWIYQQHVFNQSTSSVFIPFIPHDIDEELRKQLNIKTK